MDDANFPAESPTPAPVATGMEVEEHVEHRYAENQGVKIHYAVLGEGPLIVMLHGFPDFWYTWRYQRPRSPEIIESPPSTCAAITSAISPKG